MTSFKQKYSFAQRKAESTRVRETYPDKKPFIVEVHNSSSKDFKELKKHKYLVPNDMTVGQFIHTLRKQLKLQPSQAVFVFINGTLPTTYTLVGTLYNEYHDEDGFVYCVLQNESVFG
jgi:GABA(A) receptor-associated protein